MPNSLVSLSSFLLLLLAPTNVRGCRDRPRPPLSSNRGFPFCSWWEEGGRAGRGRERIEEKSERVLRETRLRGKKETAKKKRRAAKSLSSRLSVGEHFFPIKFRSLLSLSRAQEAPLLLHQLQRASRDLGNQRHKHSHDASPFPRPGRADRAHCDVDDGDKGDDVADAAWPPPRQPSSQRPPPPPHAEEERRLRDAQQQRRCSSSSCCCCLGRCCFSFFSLGCCCRRRRRDRAASALFFLFAAPLSFCFPLRPAAADRGPALLLVRALVPGLLRRGPRPLAAQRVHAARRQARLLLRGRKREVRSFPPLFFF